MNVCFVLLLSCVPFLCIRGIPNSLRECLCAGTSAELHITAHHSCVFSTSREFLRCGGFSNKQTNKQRDCDRGVIGLSVERGENTFVLLKFAI